MTPDLILAASFVRNLFWGLGATVLFFLGVILIAVILIQDSKEGGLGGAFGGAGGDSILGAKAQRGIVRFTAIVGIAFGCLVLVLAKLDPANDRSAAALPGDSDAPTADDVLPAPEEAAEEAEDPIDRVLEGLDVDTTPPAEGTTTPPAGGTTTPPAGGTTTPPAGGGTATPPAGGTATPPGDS